ALVLVILYLPLFPPILFSLGGGHGESLTLRWYGALGDNPLLAAATGTTLAVALVTAVAAPILGLLAAMAVRELKAPRLILLLVLLPLFIPGVSMGLATALFFRMLDLPPSLWSIAIVHILWALPFATLIILTVMAGFDPIYLEAAYMAGANRWRAFRDVEFPLIRAGVLGAATFAMILSFNETVRTQLVQGPRNTVQTYIWSTYLQVGLSPALYALMSLLILVTVALLALFLGAARRQAA
ncbi:MAG: ABC transporter permease subunit, partial [Alphaproteobacteria bacterium]|nr:ABC transporter permease subunit [Alphaproteobacteria bacterium]